MKKTGKILSLILALCILIPVCSGISQNALAAGSWVAAWGTSTVNGSVNVSGLSLQDIIPSHSTLRTELTVTAGGTELRFTFSNEYGAASIRINGASVAKTDTSNKASIVDGTQTVITFDEKNYVDVPAGGRVTSDPVDFTTKALDKLSVSLYFENLTYITSTGLSNGRTYLAAGSALLGSTSKINNTSLSGANEITVGSGSITYHAIPFLSEIDAYTADPNAVAAVFIGDSTLVNDTYLDFAEKVITAGANNISVINEAIVGNKLLSPGKGLIGKLYGDALVDRFDRDALNIPGIKYCFVKIGLNDILHQYTKSMSSSTPKYNAYDIIRGYEKLADRAHAKGVKIYFFTKTAWNGYERSFLGQTGDLTWNADAQKMCDELDDWIKTNKTADGFIDCAPLSDPSDKTKLCSTLTQDGAHLTDLGAVALADLIPLEYIGVSDPNAKTCAQIKNVDPYAQKRDIERQLEAKANEPATTAPAENDEPTRPAAEQPVTSPAPVTEPVTPAVPQTTIPFVVPTTVPVSEYTVPYYQPVTEKQPSVIPGTERYVDYEVGNNVNYVVNDVDVESIGTDVPIPFLLFLFTSVMAAGTVVILTIGKKKEQY